MRAQKACLECLKRQTEHFLSLQGLDSDKKRWSLECEHILSAYQGSAQTPPQIAIEVYEKLAQFMGVKDPFLSIKQESVKKAEIICAQILENYPAPDFNAQNPDSISKRLEWAIKIAILGNVIDYGSQSEFSFENADFGFENLSFGDFALEPFMQRLQNARSLLYLADNAGENVFDGVLMHTLKELYPELQLYYALRSQPIINDLSMEDLAWVTSSSVHGLCEVVDSGVRSPGFVLEDAGERGKALFAQADVILAKGMGNFECLESRKDPRLFLLFKIKCDVVASFCALPRGMMVFKHNVEGVIC